jgi:CheY-like chemotaxis protein
VEIANNGEEGLSLLERKMNFDLIITDIRMPRMDGNTFAKRIRDSDNLQQTPILAITGYNEEVDRDLFDSVLVKPFKMKDLIEIVEMNVSLSLN